MYRECLPDYRDRHHYYLYGKPRGTRRTPTGGRNDGKARRLEADQDDSDEQWIRDRWATATPQYEDDDEREDWDEQGTAPYYQSLGYSWELRDK